MSCRYHNDIANIRSVLQKHEFVSDFFNLFVKPKAE